jgi:hypothetical protein
LNLPYGTVDRAAYPGIFARQAGKWVTSRGVVCEDDYRVILGSTLCGDGGQGHPLGYGLDDCESALGQDVQSDVATHLCPFVVLFSEYGADESDEGVAGGEDADDVGASADVPVQPLLRVVGPDLLSGCVQGSAPTGLAALRS